MPTRQLPHIEDMSAGFVAATIHFDTALPVEGEPKSVRSLLNVIVPVGIKDLQAAMVHEQFRFDPDSLSGHGAPPFVLMVFLRIALGIFVEDPPLFGILTEMAPRFSELNKVRVISEQLGKYEGYVISSRFLKGRWIYKISISEDPSKPDTFDNWIPEECLELAR